MTMNKLKPFAVAFFNQQISDATAQYMFADAFDLWSEEPALYSAENSAYRAVIWRYVRPINEEIARIALADNHPWTRQTTVTGNENGQDTDDDTHTRENNRVDTTENNNGERKNSTLIYPQAYTDNTDIAYISQENIDAASVDSSNVVGKDDETYTGNHTHKHIADTTHVSEEVDVVRKAQLLSKSSILSDLIESCVFALLGGRVEYVHNHHCGGVI